MVSQEVLNALDKLHIELEKLEPAIKHVETAQLITETVKTIPQKHLKLLEEIKVEQINHSNELKEIFLKNLQEIIQENEKLLNTTKEIQQQVKKEQEYLEQLKDSIELLFKKIQDVHFPERLDKLDANVAGIMAGIQSIQSRTDSLERNITDRLKDFFDFQKETRLNMQSGLAEMKNNVNGNIEKSAKKQQTLTYVSWGLIIISVIIFFIVTRVGK